MFVVGRGLNVSGLILILIVIFFVVRVVNFKFLEYYFIIEILVLMM